MWCSLKVEGKKACVGIVLLSWILKVNNHLWFLIVLVILHLVPLLRHRMLLSIQHPVWTYLQYKWSTTCSLACNLVVHIATNSFNTDDTKANTDEHTKDNKSVSDTPWASVFQVLCQWAFCRPAPRGRPARRLHRHTRQWLIQRGKHAICHHLRQRRDMGAASATCCRQPRRNCGLPGMQSKLWCLQGS